MVKCVETVFRDGLSSPLPFVKPVDTIEMLSMFSLYLIKFMPDSFILKKSEIRLKSEN